MINIPFYNLWETELCAICTFSLFQLYSRLNVSIVLHAVLYIHHSIDIWNNGNILIFNIYYHTHQVVERVQTHVTFSHRKFLVWQYETTFSVTIDVSTMRHISLFDIFFLVHSTCGAALSNKRDRMMKSRLETRLTDQILQIASSASLRVWRFS